MRKTRQLCVRVGMSLVMAALLAGQNCAPATGGGGGGGGGNLAGVWQGSYNDPLVGFTVIDLTLQADGNFTETYQSTSNLTYISGLWYQDFAGTPGLLRLQVFDYYPKEFCGGGSCTPIQPIAGESWFYAFGNGGNTLQLTNFYCTDLNAPGCVIVHGRIQ